MWAVTYYIYRQRCILGKCPEQFATWSYSSILSHPQVPGAISLLVVSQHLCDSMKTNPHLVIVDSQSLALASCSPLILQATNRLSKTNTRTCNPVSWVSFSLSFSVASLINVVLQITTSSQHSVNSGTPDHIEVVLWIQNSLFHQYKSHWYILNRVTVASFLI